jgi:hypothetical protein
MDDGHVELHREKASGPALSIEMVCRLEIGTHTFYPTV